VTLTFSHLSKAFPGVQALADVSFSVKPGSIHALCGENGAGKSTLLKILSGVYTSDAGEMKRGEQVLRFTSPVEAIRGGVAVIYQELHLVPELSVAENILLGHLPTRLGWLDKRQMHTETQAHLQAVGLDVPPETKVGSLSLAQRQMVEIAKALSRDAQIIAFDEPTSSLSHREVDALFALMERLRARGKVILYVSHRMDEIFRICDAATVLRDGQHVVTYPTLQGVTPDDIVRQMVGREITDIWGYTPRETGDVLLESHGITVRAGEIVGIFGLVGAGRTELLKEIYANPQKCIASGIVLCPEDRKKEGIVPMRSVEENINLSVRRTWGFWIRSGRERANAENQISALRVKTPNLAQPIALLSGGNQQKAILGRWLSEKVRVLLLDEPTRGIDVGAKREIYEILYGLAKEGVGIVFVSSELPEVLGVADRVLVMRQGQIVADLPRMEATPPQVLALALPISTTN
jgi:L-arabinose transport system ATP-binding protein